MVLGICSWYYDRNCRDVVCQAPGGGERMMKTVPERSKGLVYSFAVNQRMFHKQHQSNPTINTHYNMELANSIYAHSLSCNVALCEPALKIRRGYLVPGNPLYTIAPSATKQLHSYERHLIRAINRPVSQRSNLRAPLPITPGSIVTNKA